MELSDKTVIRAGWGLFFNQAAYNIQTALTENLPFFFNKSVNTAATTLIPTSDHPEHPIVLREWHHRRVEPRLCVPFRVCGFLEFQRTA